MPTKILLVEDDPFLLDMYSTKFKEVGFDVSIAQDGEMAIVKSKRDFTRSYSFGCCLPKKDGFEVLKVLKSDSETAKIPVVMLTNLGLDSDVKEV